MDLTPFLAQALAMTALLKYPLLALGAFIEGPILMITSGFLLHEKILSLLPLFIALVVGDLAADLAWYYIGYYFAEPFLRRFGRWFGFTEQMYELAREIFLHYHEKVLFISKVTLGFGLAIGTLMFAGASRIPLRRYMWLNFWGELILVAFLLSVGYFFGALYQTLAVAYRGPFLIALLVLSILSVYGGTSYLKKLIAEKI